MSSNDFCQLATIYLKQVTWKSETLDEFVDCIKMIVSAAIEKRNQQVKLVPSIVEVNRLVFKVIQKINFKSKELVTKDPHKQESSIIKN